MSDISQNEKRILMRLLRFIGRDAGTLVKRDAMVEITHEVTGKTERFSSEAVEQSLSLGLLRMEKHRVVTQPAASSFLKRAMVKERDEIFQEQHRLCEAVTVDIAGERQTAQRNELSSPLLSLRHIRDRDGQSFFSTDALEAGDRLARDFHRAQLSPRITASWEPQLAKRAKGQVNGVQEISDTAAAARMRFSRATEAMGPELAGVAIDICCFEKGLETVERERQWPVRSAKLMLRTALLALSRHYSPPAPPTHRATHHWGTEDYRPRM